MNYFLLFFLPFFLASCVTQKKYNALQLELNQASDQMLLCRNNLDISNAKVERKDEQIAVLQKQLDGCMQLRDKQLMQVGDVTVLSQLANQSMNQTLAQLATNEHYIQKLKEAKNTADSVNLALAANLQGTLKEGIADKDIDVGIDKTVVFVNLSDRILFKSGRYDLTPEASGILQKIATVIKSRPDIDIMVEGYTDSNPIKTKLIPDNWDLSVKRSTSVVRALQSDYGIDPNHLIAAGRGQYHAIAENDTPKGREMNRRTTIVIMPKLGQFYDLLDSSKMPK